MDKATKDLLQSLASHQSQTTRIADKMTDLIATQSILLGLVAEELGMSEKKIMELRQKAKTETSRINLMLDDLNDAA